MAMRGADIKNVRLVPDTVWMFDQNEQPKHFNEATDGEKDVFLFAMNNLTLELINARGWKYGLKMELVLKRDIQAELFITYIPTLVLLAITFITTKFKREYFEAVMGVNLTLMLMLFTIFTTKISELPKTSYVKMIDIWLILCTLVPFVEVVLITIIEHFKEENDDDKDQEKAIGNTGEWHTNGDIQTLKSGKRSKVAPEIAWPKSNSSFVSSIPRNEEIETAKNSDGATTTLVCEVKEEEKDGENPAPKENQVKAKTTWTRMRKLRVFKTIGRA